MRALSSSLTVRLVALALVQLAVLGAVATAIAWLTLPPPPGRHPHPGDFGPPHARSAAPLDGPPARGAPPHGPPPPHAVRRGPPPSARRPPPLEGRAFGPLLTLFAGVVVLGVGGYLTAQWLVVPLRRLARTARAVGEGDLEARAALDRADEIGDVARALDDMVERVAAQLAAERELIANVSHELRTPMARIRVATDLAAEGDAEAARMALEDISTDLAELEGIVGDILMASRLDAARRRDEPALRPGAVVETTTLEIARAAETRFRVRHPERALCVEGDGAPIRADPALLRRAVDNLLENATKYSPDPGTAITLMLSSDGQEAAIAVTDEGVGIAPEDLERVFEPFFRVERSRTRGAGGVGLGLTLVTRIVSAHGGRVEARSELGEGTTVTLRLPQARS